MQLKFFYDLIDCNVGLILDQQINILEIFLSQNRFTPTQRSPCLDRTSFAHSFFKTINGTGINRKTFCNFFCIVSLIPSFNEQFSCFIM